MSNETEKLTINLGVVELAQIDVLVEQGLYSNRSDFIRTAVRKQLEINKESIDLSFARIASKNDSAKTVIGICRISKKELEKLASHNEKTSINVIGMLIVDSGIGAELFENTVHSVTLRGKLAAPAEIKALVEAMN